MNQKIYTDAISLSNNDNRPTNYRLSTQTDLERMVGVTGELFLKYLNEIKASVYVAKSPLTHAKDELSCEPIYPHTSYSLGIVLGNHLIFLFLYEPTFHLFPKSLEISFVFKSDYKKDTKQLFTRTKRVKYQKGQDSLDLENIKFLIQMKNLIEKIRSRTDIYIFYTSKQRGHIYKRALNHLKNVHFKPSRSVSK